MDATLIDCGYGGDGDQGPDVTTTLIVLIAISVVIAGILVTP